jgi:hypothetical protein
MSETPEVPPGEAEPTEPAPPDPPPDQPPSGRSRLFGGVLALLAILGSGLVAGVVAYVVAPGVPPVWVEPARVAALEDQVGALRQRVEALEKRPAATPQASPDLHPLEARIAALEQRPAVAPQPAPDLGPLQSRVDALQRRAADLSRLQAATLALSNGQPLGAWPDAPPALARFATAKPPTEGGLRLDFAPAARRAAEASKPPAPSGSLAERMWTRIASLVTVRQGGRVLVGAPASTVLDAAGARLDAGDLAGAVAALDALDPAAAAAMADWRARAQSLLDARAALARLAQD